MLKLKIILILKTVLYLFFPVCNYCQPNAEDEFQELLFDRIGNRLEISEDAAVYESFVENFRNPLNLNEADFDKLKNLQVLSDFQIIQLLDHIKKFGPLHSEYELQSVPGFDKESIKRLLLFAEIKETVNIQQPWKGYILSRTHLLVQRKKGFHTDDIQQRFYDSPFSTLLKIRAEKSQKLAFGLTLENDAGESFHWNPEKQWFGAGFTSGFIEYRSSGLLNSVLIGDMQANWGQGLVFGGGFQMGKGRFTTSSQKHISSGLVPYRSSAEAGFMRGMGITLGREHIKMTTLVSSTAIDATLNEDGDISSRYTSGLFRNQAEISKKGVGSEKTVGVNIHFNYLDGNLTMGLSGVYTKFDKELNPVVEPENIFRFRGSSNVLVGSYFEFRRKNYVLYGEGAANDNQKTSYVLGILASLSNHLETLLTLRNYSSGITSFYSGNVFSESSSPANENGIYWGLKFSQPKKMNVSAYVDFFKFPWIKRSISSPANGIDYLIDLIFFPSDQLEIKALYNVERKNIDTPKELKTSQRSVDQIRKGFKTDIKINLSKRVIYKTGIWKNRSIVSEKINNGSLIYSGITFKFNSISLDFRNIITDSKDFSTRFYLYEPDVLYAFSIPVYYGQNMRYLFLMKQKFSTRLTCWLKLSGTYFRDRKDIGSGNDLISGPVKTELKFQTIWKL